jgi:hypothetical protein
MGLPVVASDIPAHRAFDVLVSNDCGEAAQRLVGLARKGDRTRVAVLTEWTEPLDMFTRAIMQLNLPSKMLEPN